MDEKTLKMKKAILDNFKSVKEFSRISEIPYTTLKSALDRGVGGTAVETVIKICELLKLDIKTFEALEDKIFATKICTQCFFTTTLYYVLPTVTHFQGF